jgi:hypothetical protein
MPSIIEIADIVLNILNDFREGAGCTEALMVASYEPNETNYCAELPPLDASSLVACDQESLEPAVRALLEAPLEGEAKSLLLSRTATHLAMWSDEELTSVKWRLINDYIRLEPVGPLIDGALVLQGAAHSTKFGPVLATVEFAADHEEDFSMVGKVVPWEMLITPPEDEHSGAQFLLPITLGADVEGTVRIIIFVDSVANIPYDEEGKEGFDAASPTFIPAVTYVNRVGGARGAEGGEGALAAAAVEGGVMVSVALCVARSPEERGAFEGQGFDLGSAVSIASDGISLVDSAPFPFVLGVAQAPAAEGVAGIEDAVFVQSASRDAMPAAPEGYELLADLSQEADEGCTFLAVRSGPAPRFTKILMFVCQEELIDVAEHFIESVLETLGGGQVRMAPNSVSQAFGARVGLLLVDGSSGHAEAEPMPVGAGDGLELEGEAGEERPPSPGPGEGKEQQAEQAEEDFFEQDESEMKHPGAEGGPSIESASFGDISEDEFDDDEVDNDQIAIDRLLLEKSELESDLARARQANVDIQRKAAIVLAKSGGKDGGGGGRGGDADGAEAAAATTNPDGAAEKERHYKETMDLIDECNKRLKREQDEYEQQALDLQTRLDDKEYKAEEIAASLRQFKREILTKAENSRTGKGVSHRLVKQFELAESKKDEDLEKVRLRNISLKTTLRKLEKMLRSREQLAEGLHMIDFEQLKIENQTWNEKIEERNEELAKLKRKKTSTVQVLTHIREKIKFIESANDHQRDILTDTEREIVENRNRLTSCKHERDGAKETNVDLKGQRGFATSDLLIMDFEQRKAVMDNLNATLNDLHERQFTLTSQVGRDNEMINTLRASTAGPVPVSGTGPRAGMGGAKKGGTSMF